MSGSVLLLLLIICVTLLIIYFGNFKVSNVVRVPFEVVKQRAQAYSNMSSLQAFKFSLQQEVRSYDKFGLYNYAGLAGSMYHISIAKSKMLSHYLTVMFNNHVLVFGKLRMIIVIAIQNVCQVSLNWHFRVIKVCIEATGIQYSERYVLGLMFS